MSNLKKANELFRSGKYNKALEHYELVLNESPLIEPLIAYNLKVIKEKKGKTYSKNNVLSQSTSKSSHGYTDFDFYAKYLDFRLNGKPRRLYKTFDFAKQTSLESAFDSSDKLKKVIEGIKASVIMPSYNRKHTIERAIDSVLSQTHANLELIIVDDGSTDGTFELVKNKYKSERLKLFKGKHGGVSRARNLGIERASGDYIFYLDSDNRWNSRYVELMLAGFVATGTELGYSGVEVHDENEKLIGYRGEPFNWSECCRSNFVDLNPFAHSRTYTEKFGAFDERLRRMVDWDMILRFTKDTQPFFLPYVGTVYTETATDLNRISVKEPYAFKKVVQVKNKYGSDIVNSLKLKFALKIPAPYEKRMQWGDYHFAESLKSSLEALGHEVVIDYHGKWYERPTNAEDVVIVLRGLTEYKPRPGNVNIMWNISHPDQVSYSEYESFDLVFVASDSYAALLNLFLNKRVDTLLQCSDHKRFFFDSDLSVDESKMLFVGNSRNEYRTVVKNAIENDVDIDIYGGGWEQFIDSSNVKGTNISNFELRKYYGSYSFTMNDHWESMKKFGFISNRVFDVVASGGRVISDNVPSIRNVFEDYVLMDDRPGSFLPINNAPELLRKMASTYVSRFHSFDKRAEQILDAVYSFLGVKNVNNSNNIVPSISGNVRQTIKVGLLLQNGVRKPTSSAYIRLFTVLTAECLGGEFDIALLENTSDSCIEDCDVVIVQRVAVDSERDAESLITKLDKSKIPLIIDTDDGFSSLSESHPQKDYYSRLDMVLRQLMDGAKNVVFSTESLKDEYDDISDDKKCVIENTLDERLWLNYRASKSEVERKRTADLNILYMGTATHDNDFLEVYGALKSLVEQGYQIKLTVIGAVSSRFNENWIEFVSAPTGQERYPRFARWLREFSSFDLGIAPLNDNDFNRMKSDIKVLDYAAINIPTLCSNVPAYEALIKEEVCFWANNTAEDWEAALKELIENPEQLVEKALQASQYLWSSRNVDHAAKKWRKLLQSATKSEPKND